MYCFEIHLHTSACSACAASTATEMIDAALKANYSGIVLTNHFYHGNTSIDRHLPYESFFAAYRDEYIEAKKYGEAKGITVLFGLERAYARGKECLIYGTDPDKLIKMPEFLNMSLPEMSDYVRSVGGLIACAHPFRVRDYIPNPNEAPSPEFFDAIEGYNHCNSDAENEKAVSFAKKNNLPIISGGDVHISAAFGKSGIAFYSPVNNNEDFVKYIKKGEYRLILNGEIH